MKNILRIACCTLQQETPKTEKTMKNPIVKIMAPALLCIFLAGCKMRLVDNPPPPTAEEIQDQRLEEAAKAAIDNQLVEGGDGMRNQAMWDGGWFYQVYHRKPTSDELEQKAQRAYRRAKEKDPNLSEPHFVRVYTERFAYSYNSAYQHNGAPAF